MGTTIGQPRFQPLPLTQAAEAIAARPQKDCSFLVPPPDSTIAMPNGSVVVPGHGANSIMLEYQVPEGMLFTVRGFTIRANVATWNQGSGDMFFVLSVEQGAGERVVEFFDNILTELGRDRPYPTMGRLEFQPLDILRWRVFSVANVSTGAGNYVTGMLSGWLYPMNRAAT